MLVSDFGDEFPAEYSPGFLHVVVFEVIRLGVVSDKVPVMLELILLDVVVFKSDGKLLDLSVDELASSPSDSAGQVLAVLVQIEVIRSIVRSFSGS